MHAVTCQKKVKYCVNAEGSVTGTNNWSPNLRQLPIHRPCDICTAIFLSWIHKFAVNLEGQFHMRTNPYLPSFEEHVEFRDLTMAELSILHHVYATLQIDIIHQIQIQKIQIDIIQLSYSFRMNDMITLHAYNIKDMVWRSRNASNIKLPINTFSQDFPHTKKMVRIFLIKHLFPCECWFLKTVNIQKKKKNYKVFCSKESQVQYDISDDRRRESMLCPMLTSGLESEVLRLLLVRLQKLRVAAFNYQASTFFCVAWEKKDDFKISRFFLAQNKTKCWNLVCMCAYMCISVCVEFLYSSHCCHRVDVWCWLNIKFCEVIFCMDPQAEVHLAAEYSGTYWLCEAAVIRFV